MSWIKLETKSNKPLSRSAHIGVNYNDKFYIQGGFSKFRLNDMHMFDPVRNEWFEIIQKGKIPPKQGKSSSLIHNNALYSFGGYSNIKHNDLYRFDFRSSKWDKINQNGLIPNERSSTSLFKYKNYMYCFGGIGKRKFNDYWRYSFKKQSWCQINQTNAPRNRSSYGGLHKWKDNKFYLCCGLGSGKFNDVHQLDAETGNWNKIICKNPKQRILPRGRHSNILYNDCLHIFGGWVSKENSNDFYKFDLNEKEWKIIKQENKPSKRAGHSSILIQNQMFLFGGCKDNNVYSVNLDTV